MDPAESIVTLWLQNDGYFVRNNIKVEKSQGKEIDILAIDPARNKRIHVESAVSVRPAGPLRPWKHFRHSRLPLDERLRLFYLNKFIGAVKEGSKEPTNRKIEEQAKSAFGGLSYEKWLVLGKQGGSDSAEEVRSVFKKHSVRVYYLDEVLSKLYLSGTNKDETGRLLQIMASYISDESKKSLLGKK